MKKVVKKVVKIPVPYVKLKEAISEVKKEEIKFPKDIGEEHPIDFEELEKLYLKVGIIKAVVDKYVDYIISPGIYVKSTKQAENLINKFIQDTGFEDALREQVREALIKGNGFMEIDLNKYELTIVNANEMYVKRDNKGKVESYNQWVGKFNKNNPNKIIPIDKNKMLHLKFNQISNSAYGYGIIHQACLTLNNLTNAEKQAHVLMERKANNPIVATIGDNENPATQEDVNNIGQQFEYLNNFHEWAFSHHVKLDVLNFGNLSEKFDSIIQHDKEMLFYIFQIPPVIMGQANVPEGLANVQMDGFERRIRSLQSNVERLIENKIFKPLLKNAGLNAHVEMFWGQMSETKTNEKLMRLTEILKAPFLSPALKASIELDMARQMGYEEAVNALPTPEEALEQAEKDKSKFKFQSFGGESNQRESINTSVKNILKE